MTDFRTRTLRILVAGALSLGVLGTASAAHALTPPAPQQIDEIANPIDPGHPTPTPPQGPGDLTNGEPDDDDCHPLMASCDITSNPGDPDDGGSGGTDGGDAEVDDAVVARPTFTG
jgi:hypothetical protein